MKHFIALVMAFTSIQAFSFEHKCVVPDGRGSYKFLDTEIVDKTPYQGCPLLVSVKNHRLFNHNQNKDEPHIFRLVRIHNDQDYPCRYNSYRHNFSCESRSDY